MAIGIVSKDLAYYTERFGAIPFYRFVLTTAGTATYNIEVNTVERGFVVIGFGGIMTGNGGVGDTVQLQDSAGNAISDAIDVSALVNDSTFREATIDLTWAYFQPNEVKNLRVVTASGATALVYAICIPTDTTTL